MISHVRSHHSQAYKAITPFCMTRFANWKLAPTIQSYGDYQKQDSSSIQQNQPTANLNLLMVKPPVIGALFFEIIPMAIISSSDITLIGSTQQQENLQPSYLPFSLKTVTVFLRWPFPKVIHPSLRDQLDPLNAWTQTVQATLEPPFRRPTSSLKNDAFAVALYKCIPDSKPYSETDGYIVNDTRYIEISFSDPSVQESSLRKHPFPPFR